MKFVFDETVLKYKGLVYSLAFSRLQNVHDAEDVFQEVFLTLYKKDMDFTDEEHLKAWLINAALKCSKKAVFKRKRITDNESPIENAYSSFFETDTQNRIFEAISRLPEKQRICIELYYIQGYSTDEICRLLGRKGSTVRMQMSRGREALREMLKGEYFDE